MHIPPVISSSFISLSTPTKQIVALLAVISAVALAALYLLKLQKAKVTQPLFLLSEDEKTTFRILFSGKDIKNFPLYSPKGEPKIHEVKHIMRGIRDGAPVFYVKVNGKPAEELIENVIILKKGANGAWQQDALNNALAPIYFNGPFTDTNGIQLSETAATNQFMSLLTLIRFGKSQDSKSVEWTLKS